MSESVLSGYFSLSELCYRYGVSRKTGYKWIKRFEETGSLEELSRRPHCSPSETKPEIIESLLEARNRHPSWGPRKLLCLVSGKHSELLLPAPSTVALILNRNGYIKHNRRKTRRYHPGRPLTAMSAPNDVWTADFKGHFKTTDGIYCYSLTIADGFSRYLFACRGMLSPLQKSVKAVFKQLFEIYGLPKKIRTDNGNPFASNALPAATDRVSGSL